MNGDERRTGVWLALVTAGISGVAVFVNADGVRRFPDATVYTTAKNVVAAIVVVALMRALAARRAPAQPLDASTRRWLVAVGLVGGGAAFVLFFEGLARASAAPVAFVHKTLVLWVVLAAVPLLRERLRPAHLAAVALLVGGQAALVDGVDRLRPDAASAMVLGATLLWAGETVVARRLLAAGRVTSDALGAARLAIGSVALIAWLAVTGRAGDLFALDVGQWAWAMGTGVLLAGYVTAWFAALRRAPAVDVTAVLVVGAIVTAALDAAFRGAAVDVAGLALLVTGVAIAVAAPVAPRPVPARMRSR